MYHALADRVAVLEKRVAALDDPTGRSASVCPECGGRGYIDQGAGVSPTTCPACGGGK